MIHKILPAIALLFWASAANAQWGVRAGANFATLATKTPSPYQQASSRGRLGYQLGVFYEKKLSQRWAFVPGLELSRQHQDLQVEESGIADGGYVATYRLALTYLNLPLLAQASLGHYYVEAGPQLGVLQMAHERGNEVIGNFWGRSTMDFDRSATDRYRRVDVGICAGAGVKLGGGLGLGVRACTGLISLTSMPQSINYSGRLRSQTIQAVVSYRFLPGS